MDISNQLDLNLLLNIITLVFNILTSIFIGFLTYLTLVFTAKPNIRITFAGDAKSGKKVFSSHEVAVLRFTLENVGHFFAKPAATNNMVHLNFEPVFQLIRARYGSRLQLKEEKERRGKGDSRYFTVSGINLYYNEEGEDVIVEVRMPEKPGKYRIKVAARSDEIDHGVHYFHVIVQ